MTLDNIDLNILKELTKDARMPISTISTRVNLSIPAISERIKKLEKGGFIEGYTAILNLKKFGKTLTCFSFISLKHSEADLKTFMEFVETNEDIMECHLITGEYEYILKIVTQGPESLGILLNNLRSKADVLASSTSISLSTLKNNLTINL